MISTWMLYWLLLSALLGAAAWAGERALLLQGRPTRWVWAATILLAVLLPPALALTATTPLPDTVAVEWQVEAIVPADAVPPLPSPATPRLALPAWLDGLLLALWLGGSLVVAGGIVLSFFEMRRQRRGWRQGVVGGEPVYLSQAEGPAVVGLSRPRIVLPRWVLGWEEAQQRLIVEHEREHIRARDPLLLLAALAALVLLPWNLALWWQRRRLRLAVEMDCDARVLRRRPDVRRYGTLLLEVGRLRSGAPLPAAAFSEPLSFLERRIRIMTRPRPRSYRLQAAGFAAAAVLVLAVACQIDRPAVVEPEPVPPPLPTRTADLAQAPTFTPFERAPEFQNRDEFQRELMRAFPPVLREAGIGGTVRVWAFIDEEGVVRNTRVVEASGQPALDEAAEAVMREVRFTPALNREQPVPVWVQFPLTFQVAADAEPSAQRLRVRGWAAPPQTVRGAAPFFTPYEQAPELLNREEFQRGLMLAYPPAQRDAGIGGTVRIWVHIDEEGSIRSTQVAESSGYPALDEAAQAVMHEARFRPARNRGQPVPVWVQMPVTFQVDAPRQESAAGRISGQVTTADTGDPLPRATVTLVGRQRGTATRYDGRFLLVDLPPGRYSVVVQREGYAGRTLADLEVRAGETRTVEVVLQPASR